MLRGYALCALRALVPLHLDGKDSALVALVVGNTDGCRVWAMLTTVLGICLAHIRLALFAVGCIDVLAFREARDALGCLAVVDVSLQLVLGTSHTLDPSLGRTKPRHRQLATLQARSANR